MRVIDHGVGLSDEAKARMFTPFSRTTDTNAGGVGLGAAVAKGLAEALGAQVHPEDTPGGGLTMVLSLPTSADNRKEPSEHRSRG